MIDYLSYIPFSIYILAQCMLPQNAVCYIQADFFILPKLFQVMSHSMAVYSTSMDQKILSYGTSEVR